MSVNRRCGIARSSAHFQVICALVAFFLFYEPIAATSPTFQLWMPSTMGDFDTILFTFLVVSITLPHAFLAWSEPDHMEIEESGLGQAN